MKYILFTELLKNKKYSLLLNNELIKLLKEVLINNKINDNLDKIVTILMILLNKLNYSDIIKIKLIDNLLNYEINRINGLNLSYLKFNKENFESHFVGFFDGDGSCRTGKRDNNLRYTPNLLIKLHIDDQEYLNIIINYFKVSTKIYYEENNTKSLLNINTEDKLFVFIKLLDNNKLLTKKYYDYILWKELFNIYYNKLIIKSDKLELCNEINKKINKYIDINKFPNTEHIINNINTNKVLGFIEAEGHFGIKSQSQKYITSLEILQSLLPPRY